jgi:hypothetical protein
MTATTIHITEEQSKWVDSNALNLSKYVRKLIDTDMARWNEITEKVLKPIINKEKILFLKNN